MTIQSLTYTTGITHKHLTSGKAFQGVRKIDTTGNKQRRSVPITFKYEALDNGRKLEVMDYEYPNSEYFVSIIEDL